MAEDSRITNRHRINYILDVLAEPFPEKAKYKSCACGAASDEKNGATTTLTGSGAKVEGEKMPCKRDLIEQALLEALKMDYYDVRTSAAFIQAVRKENDFESFLDRLSDEEIGNLLSKVNIGLIDTHLRDLALFMDPNRPVKTTFSEIKRWDKRHANFSPLGEL